MPAADRPRTIVLKYSPEYRRYLDRLLKKVAADGIRVGTIPELAELALNRWGLRYGLVAPRRMPPVGGPRPGSGRPKKTTTDDTANGA